ncbi:MAG: salicylate biosynthesis isochorismate synthase [Chloroflexota bacterium]|nr:MAG: salicylate biosynthesis isochorismate synthase [Chloroflexota bacterium]
MTVLRGWPVAPRSDRTLLIGELIGELERLVRLGNPDRRRIVSASVLAPPIDPIDVAWRALRRGADLAFWCQPLAGACFVGFGAAATVRLAGDGRFERAEAVRRELAAAAIVGGPAAGRPGVGPRLVGGAAFVPASVRDPTWHGFDDGWLRLPRLVVAGTGDEAILTSNLVLEPGTDPVAEIGAVEALAEGVLGGVDAVADGDIDGPPVGGALLRVTARIPDRTTWESAVARAAGAVSRGRLDKIVLARRVDLAADGPIDVAAVLRRLVATAPASTIFALSRRRPGDERVFLGASPERLVEVRGRAFQTVALAGTVGRGSSPEEDEALAADLLASEKDREEHAVVVDMLRTTLAPLAEEVIVEPNPRVVRLATVQHLATRFSGRLRADGGILGLVGRLHPTPAVGGWPREAALAYIEEEEGLDRGWYAGPVGWVDLAGDGEFVVGIRSGVVSGARASLFAGCGIVADSEPDREWEESELKLAALAGALGRFEGADDR